MSYPIPKDALDDRLAIVGVAGSGKTYAALGAIEHLLARKSRVIMVDPLGVAWGLRLCADGKTSSPYQPVIFGGAHGDLPINEHAGALIGQTVATMRESCIIDLSTLGTKAAERRFMLAFLTALYRETDKEPVHLIVDEADMFAPQKLLDKEGDAAKLLGMMETVVRRGRVKGFIPWLLTQRPAVLSKDVLSQADGLVALKLTSSQDRDAIGAWIEGQADKAEGRAMLASLPGKQRGEGVLWIPGRGILRDAVFPEKATFDSSRTPKRGEKRQARELQPLDLGALKGRLAAVETEAKQNDPKVLKAEIAALKKQLATAPKETVLADKAAMDRAHAMGRAEGEADGWQKGWAAGHKVGFTDGVVHAHTIHVLTAKTVADDLRKSAEMMASASYVLRPAPRQNPKSDGKYAVPMQAPVAQSAGRRISTPQAGRSNGLSKAERAILAVLAHFPKIGATRNKVAIMAGYSASSGSFSNTLSSLRTAGLLAPGDPLCATDAGIEAAGNAAPLPTGQDLLSYWCAHRSLGKAERAILIALCTALPAGMSREEVASQTGYSADSGSFNNSLSRLRTLELISGSRYLKAAEEFAP